MSDKPTSVIDIKSAENQSDNSKDNKYGTSVFKKWIYAKFDAKLILEIVKKDIYLNPKISILLPTINPNGKRTFLSATMDLKGLQNLQNELTSAINIMQEHSKQKN